MRLFKKNIIIFLSDVVAIIYFVIKRILAFLKFNEDKKLRILIYHSVTEGLFYKDLNENNVRLDAFRRQMSMLKKTSKKILSLTEGINAFKNGNLLYDSIAITFDDGIANVFNEALKVLEDFNIPATFFIVYKYIDGSTISPELDTGTGKHFMDWHMVFSLMEKGYEIGAHSYSHKQLNMLKDEDLDREIVYVKKKFEEKGIPVKYFAYPYGFYGNFSEKTEELVKKAGYKACFTNIMGNNRPGDNFFELKRTRISWRDNPFRFKMKINGAYDLLDTLKYRLSRKSKRVKR